MLRFNLTQVMLNNQDQANQILFSSEQYRISNVGDFQALK